jgi:1-acyl-sn-glycerol-3-phosphate acyltransferase
MASIRACVLIVCFVAITLVAFVWQGISVYFRCRRRKTFPPKFHRLWCRLFGIRVTRIGEPLKGKGVLLVANHTSYLDIPILGSTGQMSFISRHDAAKWPFVGIMVKLQESVLIERRKRGQAGAQLSAIRDRLAAGDNIAIFAEGTTSDNNRILPFKSSLLGAVFDETGTQDFPIQPVSISYIAMQGIPMARSDRYFYAWTGSFFLVSHVWNMLRAGPLDVVVEFHPPITNASDRKEAADKAEAAVRRGWLDGAKHWYGAA